ncbi:MAG: hypothetical protein AB7G13_07100 [Lautropia sp.]
MTTERPEGVKETWGGPAFPCAGGRIEIALTIAADHPAFDGHFPGRPILPGVVLLAEVLAAIEQAIGRPLATATIRNAKFHATVAPGTMLAIAFTPAPVTGFEVRAGTTRVASGTIDLPPSAAADRPATP